MRYGCEWHDARLDAWREWHATEGLSAGALQQVIDALPVDTWLHVRSNRFGWLHIPSYLLEDVKPSAKR